MTSGILENIPMDDDAPTLCYWGKATRETSSGSLWHPLVYHGLEVAACGRQLLEADTKRRQDLAALTGGAFAGLAEFPPGDS